MAKKKPRNNSSKKKKKRNGKIKIVRRKKHKYSKPERKVKIKKIGSSQNSQIRKNKRKGFLPSLLLIILLWLGIGGFVYFTTPDSTLTIILFLLLLFAALVFTLSFIFINTRRGVVVAIGVITFLILRLLGVGNLINLFLISGIIIAIEIYFSKS